MFNIYLWYLQEKAMALKIGRQKKIQIIDGQQMEVLTGDSEEEPQDNEDYDELFEPSEHLASSGI